MVAIPLQNKITYICTYVHYGRIKSKEIRIDVYRANTRKSVTVVCHMTVT